MRLVALIGCGCHHRLARLLCFNQDMTKLLPGKLWLHLWPLWFLCCLILGVLPIYVALQKNQKKFCECSSSNAAQGGASRDEKHNPVFPSTATCTSVALIGLHFVSAQITPESPLSLPWVDLISVSCTKTGLCSLDWITWTSWSPHRAGWPFTVLQQLS